MNNHYDKITASHYAAYRPALHKEILSLCIDLKIKYLHGLDIGCGTGHSSIALATYCDTVIGIEPSAAMLSCAIAHPQVVYKEFNGKTFPFNDNQFDIVTFAGSLYYAKSQSLLNDLLRISGPGASIVVYDFELQLQPILASLKIKPDSVRFSPYNHEENFSNLKSKILLQLDKQKNTSKIFLTPEELAHLLLSIKELYKAFRRNYNSEQIYEHILKKLKEQSNNKRTEILTNLYYTTYTCIKP